MNTSLNQHEAKQSQENFFYNSIKEKVKKSEIDKIFDKIIKNNYLIEKEQFELLGNISYIFGNDFTGQRNFYKKIVIENFALRIKDFEITPEQLRKFQNIMENISVENIEKTKDELKELIIKSCNFSGETIHKIKSSLNGIFRDSNFSVSYVVEIDEIMKTKKFNYGQLLKANKLIYENINMSGASFKNLRLLFNNEEYKKEIVKASDYYDLQKFSLVYFDCILTLKEWFELEKKSDYIDFVENPELINNIVEFSETENIIENIDVIEEKEFVAEQESPENTDKFLRGIIFEILKTDKITSANELLETFNKILNQEDLVQYVYQYIKGNQLKNRTPFEDIFEFEKSEFIDVLKTQYNDCAKKYKDLVEKYVSEISPDYLPKVVNYVNDLITSLLIDNSEKKSYLFQQLNENQIYTFKHLHQTIGLIEDCNISGAHINTYTNLRDYLENNTNIKEIFESIGDIDKLQLEINFFNGILEFYSDETYNNAVNEIDVNVEFLNADEVKEIEEQEKIEQDKILEDESKSINSIDAGPGLKKV
jgi:hypothetical protein